MKAADDGMFVFIVLFIGFKVETDVGINASCVPVWIFRMLFVLRVLKVQIWGSSDRLFFSKVSTEESNKKKGRRQGFDGGFQWMSR